MTTLNVNLLKEARLIAVNKNSVVLEVANNEQVFCHRRIFNQIVNSDEDLPVFITEREYRGTMMSWVAIPKTI